MYPTLHDLIKDLTGLSIPLPINSFGFFVAVAFLLGAYVLQLEMKRKERENILLATVNQKGKPIHPYELVPNIIVIAVLIYTTGKYAA